VSEIDVGATITIHKRTIVAGYLKLLDGESARTVEFVPDVLHADYDAQGRLIGR